MGWLVGRGRKRCLDTRQVVTVGAAGGASDHDDAVTVEASERLQDGGATEARARGQRGHRGPRLGGAVAVVVDDGEEDDFLGGGTRRAPDGSLHSEQIAHGTLVALE
jgi:hypothetical protein